MDYYYYSIWNHMTQAWRDRLAVKITCWSSRELKLGCQHPCCNCFSIYMCVKTSFRESIQLFLLVLAGVIHPWYMCVHRYTLISFNSYDTMWFYQMIFVQQLVCHLRRLILSVFRNEYQPILLLSVGRVCYVHFKVGPVFLM